MSIQPGLKRWISIGALVLLVMAGTTIGGIQGTGFRALVAYGTVDAGSGLNVNGVPYDTSHAHVVVNGRPADVSQLRAGHIVTTRGSIALNGSIAIADEIIVESDVRGEVTSVDADHATFTVLGQTVELTGQSIFDPRIQPNSLAGLTTGTWVKVSAFERADGTYVASRVDLDLAPGGLQVRGVAESLDPRKKTLRVGGLTVDYSAAVTDGVVAEGAIVIAQGLQPQPGGPLFASSLEVFGGVGHGGEHGDVRGIVTTFASSAEFEVNGQPVLADDRTTYELKGQSLAQDLEVRVTGRFDASGILIADKVQADGPPAGGPPPDGLPKGGPQKDGLPGLLKDAPPGKAARRGGP